MTLEEFIARSNLQLLAFKHATLEHSKTDASFHLNRDEVDWWREVATYFQCVELEKKFKQE